MAESNVEIAHRLDEKVTMLISRYRALKEKYSVLEAENERLTGELKRSQESYQELEHQMDICRIASGLGGNMEASAEAKKRINQLVREIDKCIALLNR